MPEAGAVDMNGNLKPMNVLEMSNLTPRWI